MVFISKASPTSLSQKSSIILFGVSDPQSSIFDGLTNLCPLNCVDIFFFGRVAPKEVSEHFVNHINGS